MKNALINFYFNNQSVRVVEIDFEQFWVAKDTCDILGYKNHNDAINRHCKGVVKHYPLTSGGGVQNVRVINEADLMRLIVHCRLPIGEKFERWIFEEVLPSIRRTGSYNPSERLEQILDQLQVAEQKLQLFEEYNEDILYDFDQVSSAMHKYIKPPFGPKHLKKWLADRGIICSAHYKNDKPAQRFIDNGWFQLVMHEWKRRGQRRYEPRYYITQRGFNCIIDIAINERLLKLPAPKQNCLPFYEENSVPIRRKFPR